MDELTKKGLAYIEANKPMLIEWTKKFYKSWRTKGILEDDHWIMFNTITGGVGGYKTDESEFIDLNIWREEDTGDWHATAYPMEINSIETVQTNTQDFIRLW